MPSYLTPENEDIFAQWLARAAATRDVQRIRIGSPWQGYTPDLDPNQFPPSGMSECTGLVARPGPSSIGEVLMPDAGFTTVPADATGLPLTTTTGSNTAITMIAMFNRTKSDGTVDNANAYDKTHLVLVGGDDATAGATELWRRVPATGAWEQVPYSQKAGGAGVGVTAGHEASASREFLSDWAEFPAGAPGRSEYSGAITEPVFVWCNLQDRVFVYPVDDGVVADSGDGAYEVLTYDLDPTFKARTVEHFAGRLYFGNTIEGSNHHRQRVRRTALFTADPSAAAGSGAFDVRDFSGDLLRLEKLGDLLVAYFEDGVAFIRATDVATAPDRVQLLREKRGLLSTHAVTSTGAQEHFGIFDDGWFFLDPSGRWTEVGMVTIDGVQTGKWKETFYSLLDYDKKDRIVISYDRQFIRIAFPTVQDIDAGNDNLEVWIFDPRGNRVFRDRYQAGVICWGLVDAQVQDATLWSALSGTWSALDGSWDSLAARFGLRNLNHGTPDGYVLVHNYDIYTKYNTSTNAAYNGVYGIVGPLTPLGDPTTFKRMDKLWVEHIHTGDGNLNMLVRGDFSDSFEGGVVNYDTSATAGDVNTIFRTFNFSATNLRYALAGSDPIRIRSILADVTFTPAEERLG